MASSARPACSSPRPSKATTPRIRRTLRAAASATRSTARKNRGDVSGSEGKGGGRTWSTDEAKEKGQIVAVFYKAGYLKSIGAENTSWSKGAEMLPCELPWEDVAKQGHTMTDKGLGGSQRG